MHLSTIIVAHLFNKRDDTRAIADYSKAIQLNPDFILAYQNRALSV